MIHKKGFDSEVYLKEQAAAISRRLSLFPIAFISNLAERF